MASTNAAPIRYSTEAAQFRSAMHKCDFLGEKTLHFALPNSLDIKLKQLKLSLKFY